MFKPLCQKRALAKSYSLNEVPKILIEGAHKKLLWHQSEGHRIVVVSASIDDWIKPWCDSLNLELLCTELSDDKEYFDDGDKDEGNDKDSGKKS